MVVLVVACEMRDRLCGMDGLEFGWYYRCCYREGVEECGIVVHDAKLGDVLYRLDYGQTVQRAGSRYTDIRTYRQTDRQDSQITQYLHKSGVCRSCRPTTSLSPSPPSPYTSAPYPQNTTVTQTPSPY